MECRHPPPLTEDDLTAALDGEARPEVLEHLADCPVCRARLDEARQIERRIRKGLHRWDCPTPQELGEYHLKLSSPDDARRISAHLTECRWCQAELAELQTFMGTETSSVAETVRAREPELSPVARTQAWLGEIVAQLVPRSPALAMRGEGYESLIAQAGSVTIFLEVQSLRGETVLAGQLAADDQPMWTGALVELRQNGQLQAVDVLDELGTFRCAPFDRRPSDLRIAAAGGRAIRLENFEFAD